MAKIIVPRTDYIRQLDSYRSDTDLLKIVTGVRRCGKSELLKQFRQHLIDDGVPEPEIIYNICRMTISSNFKYQHFGSPLYQGDNYRMEYCRGQNNARMKPDFKRRLKDLTRPKAGKRFQSCLVEF